MSLNTATVIKWSVAAFLLFNVFAGPLHYVFGSAGLAALAYLPKIEFFALVMFVIISGKAKVVELYFVLAIFTLFFLVGLEYLPSKAQSLFGLWTLSPLLFALISSRSLFLTFENYEKIFLFLFITVVTGVIVNEFHAFPWAGQSFEIAGQQVSTSRVWSVEGVSRIAGFSGASFFAATQAIMLAIFVIQNMKSKVATVCVWLFAGVAVGLTTSKGPLLAYTIITPLVFARILQGFVGPIARLLFSIFFKTIAVFIVLTMILVPLSTLWSNYTVSSSSRLQQLLFGSFQVRLVLTWPDALAPLRTATSFLFGRGIGAIGVAQTYFDPTNYNPADNMFVYILVQLGLVLTLAILFYLTVKFLTTGRPDSLHTIDFTFRALWLLVMVEGCTVNVLEDPFLATALGLCVAYRNTWKAQLVFQPEEGSIPIRGPVGLIPRQT